MPNLLELFQSKVTGLLLHTSRFSWVWTIQQGSRFSYRWPHQLSATLHFPISEQSKHLSLLPGKLLVPLLVPDVPDVHMTGWMWTTRSMWQHNFWEWRAEGLQWKGEELFCFGHCRWGVGTSLTGCGRPALLQLSEMLLLCKTPCITNPMVFRLETMVHSWICLNQSGTLTYKQKSEWQINSLKTIFVKLKVQLFRNTDDPYQYISDNTAASCSRLDFLSLLYHPFYLILA